MKFERLSCVLLVSSMLFLQPAFAQDTGSVKIGYVDVNSVALRSPQWEEGNKSLEKEFGARKKAIRDKELALGQLQERAQKEGRTMKSEELRKLEDQMLAQSREIQYQKSILEDDYKRQHNRMMADLEQEISQTVVAIVKQDGYDLILTGNVAMASARVNLTDRVLGELKNGANSAANKKK